MKTTDDKPKGLECLGCGCRHFRVDKTQPETNSIIRRRTCRNCGRLMLTKEREVPDADKTV